MCVKRIDFIDRIGSRLNWKNIWIQQYKWITETIPHSKNVTHYLANGKNEKLFKDTTKGETCNNKIQSTIVREIRKICRSDDMCKMYKYTDQLLIGIKEKEVTEEDFSIIIHLLNKKKFHDSYFWREITNLHNLDFIFSMHLKQIVLFIYSVANSYTRVSLPFLNQFVDGLIIILKIQRQFFQTLHKITLTLNEKEETRKRIEFPKQVKWIDIINRKKRKEDNNSYKDSLLDILLKKKNHLNFLDVTLLCNSFSKINSIEYVEGIHIIKKHLLQLGLGFLFTNQIGLNHLCLFLYSFIKLKGTIAKPVIQKVKHVLMKKNTENVENIHTLSIQDLNMLMYALAKEISVDPIFCKNCILSFVLQLNVKEETKKTKSKGNILNNEAPFSYKEMNLHDNLFIYQTTKDQIIPFDNNGIYQNTILKKQLITYFSRYDYTYEKEENSLINLKKKDFCVFINNIKQIIPKNYYNIYTYIQEEAKRKCPFFTLYDVSILLTCLVQVEKLQEQFLLSTLPYINFLFNKNNANEKDTVDITNALYIFHLQQQEQQEQQQQQQQRTIVERKSTELFVALQTFLKNIYRIVEPKIKSYNFQNVISLFCSFAYFDISMNESIIQDTCIDILNHVDALPSTTRILIFLYYLKRMNYELSYYFIPCVLHKILLRIRDSQVWFFFFQFVCTYATEFLTNEVYVKNMMLLGRKNISLLQMKQKWLILLYWNLQPLLLTKYSFHFCKLMLDEITHEEKKTNCDQILRRNSNHNEKHLYNKENKYINRNIKESNKYYKTNFFNQYKLFLYTPIDSLLEELPLDEIQRIISILTLFENYNNHRIVSSFIYRTLYKKGCLSLFTKWVLTNKNEVKFESVYIPLDDICISYAKHISVPINKNTKELQQIPHSDENQIIEIIHDDNITKKEETCKLRYEFERKNHFEDFEETLFNIIKLIYEESIICCLSKNKTYNNTHNSHTNFHNTFCNSIYYKYNKIYTKVQKNVSLHSFYVPYIIKQIPTVEML